ncbi:MAG TPA: hybrid sensor histidine kinase/response regulator [Planctomycetota bacterium]|nr:hybrid sensor histidine kinase/response regulator [Planctomycetota bacterium]
MPPARKLALVIDDEESMRDSCRQVLERDSWRVATCGDGMVGYRLFHEQAPDLVLVDLKMPGIDGMELVSRIAAEDPTVATVVITGYATVESAVEAMKKGAYDFLPKPFTPAELRVVAWRNLEKRQLFIRNRQLLAEKERMQENFVTLVSHEMRSPLVAVEQYIEVLLANMAGELNAKQAEILRKMRTKTEWLLALVKEWLSVSRIQGLTQPEKMEPLEIEPLLHQAADLLAPMLREQQTEVTITVQQSIEPVEGDREALVHVFLNLVSNAAKYSDPRGKVAITAKVQAGELVVDVADTGWGIPEEHLPFIFDDFYRVRAKELPKTTGTGLGLSIVKKIVDAHRGRVVVKSTMGKGSTFSVYLPLKQAREQATT